MTILIFIIVLAVLIFVHELGHFLAARDSDVRVEEFSIGFPPHIASWKRRGDETSYHVGLIPLGGYVKIFGEDGLEENIADKDKKRSFIFQPRLVQAKILVAGIVFNILFAWLAFAVGGMVGTPTLLSLQEAQGSGQGIPELFILDVEKNSPAAEVGLQPGDVIAGIDSPQEISVTPENIRFYIQTHPEGIPLEIQRDDEIITVDVTPETLVREQGTDLFGIGIEMGYVGIERTGVVQAIIEGAENTVYTTRDIIVGIGTLISLAFEDRTELASSVAGPIGIAQLVGEVSGLGFGYLLNFTAFISINLAILNLLPFPALDGGRLVVVGVEAIKRSRINPRVVRTINLIGFALLILLMLIVTWNDIARLL